MNEKCDWCKKDTYISDMTFVEISSDRNIYSNKTAQIDHNWICYQRLCEKCFNGFKKYIINNEKKGT